MERELRSKKKKKKKKRKNGEMQQILSHRTIKNTKSLQNAKNKNKIHESRSYL